MCIEYSQGVIVDGTMYVSELIKYKLLYYSLNIM